MYVCLRTVVMIPERLETEKSTIDIKCDRKKYEGLYKEQI